MNINWKLLHTLFFLMILTGLLAQDPPDMPSRSIVVNSTQNLSFGVLTILSGSTGGTVTVDYNGMRTASGSVVLLNSSPQAQQGIYEVKICPGRLVNISYPNSVVLTGNNGGSLTMNLGPTDKGPSGSSFISNKGCNDVHYVNVGGVLTVGSMAANPPGDYSGTFEITFIQQ